MATRPMSTARFVVLSLGLILGARTCDSRESPGPLPVAREVAVVPSEPGAALTAPDESVARKPEPAGPRGNPLWGIPLRALSATRERP